MSAYKGERVKTTFRLLRSDRSDMQKMADSLGLESMSDYLLFAHKRLVSPDLVQEPATDLPTRAKALRIEAEHPKCEPPKIDTLWRHRNGIDYIVVGYSNKLDTPKYPLNVLHRNIHNGELYNRAASDWSRSFKPVASTDFIREGEHYGQFFIDIPGIYSGSLVPLTECAKNAWRITEECMIDRIKDHLNALPRV